MATQRLADNAMASSIEMAVDLKERRGTALKRSTQRIECLDVLYSVTLEPSDEASLKASHVGRALCRSRLEHLCLRRNSQDEKRRAELLRFLLRHSYQPVRYPVGTIRFTRRKD